MIFTANKTVTIMRFDTVSGETSYDVTVATWLQLYIEPLDDTIWATVDWQWAFDVQKMFTDFIDVQVSDKIIDQNWEEYIVKWVKHYDSLVWQHLECIVQQEYD